MPAHEGLEPAMTHARLRSHSTRKDGAGTMRIARRVFIKQAAAAGTALGSGLIAAPAVFAQDAYPSKPIKFVVPLAPGGAIDFIARAVGERMSGSIGQQIIVENRTGAGGTVGMDSAMK